MQSQGSEEMEQENDEKLHQRRIAFAIREIHNQIRQAIHKSLPRFEKGPKSQLQGGILGYLFHHGEAPVYQRDLEKEFKISRATATNTLQVMERDGLIVRRAQDKDGRLKRIQMTEETHRNHSRVEAHMEMVDGRMLGGLTDAEVAELRRLLGMVQKNLEELVSELGDSCGEEGEKGFGSPEQQEEEGENSARERANAKA